MIRTRRRQAQAPSRPPAWLWAAGACFVLYFGLVVAADILRPGPSGLQIVFEDEGPRVVGAQPGSPPVLAGVRPGDRIRTAAGRPLHTRQDWFSISANLLAGQPVSLLVDRAGTALAIAYTPPRQPLGPLTARADTLALLAARAVQGLSLGLALLIVLRRPSDRLARLTAWLLASFGTFTVLLPYGIGRLWRLVPMVLQPMLWVPFLSGIVAPAVFFGFAACVPRPYFRHRRTVVACCAPALLPAAWHAWLAWIAIYQEARIPVGIDWSRLAGVVSIAYLVAGVAMLGLQYRRQRIEAERRRLRVLLAGTVVGLLAGAFVAAVVLIGRDPRVTSSLFDSPGTLVAVPLLAAIPVSVGYTILRDRWFGLTFILRQGVRYALARRLLLSLVPLLVGLLAFDVFLHRDEPLRSVVREHWWRYAAAAAALGILIVNRRRWVVSLDRRFFHEHYRAERILQSVAGELRQAADPSQAVAVVVQQIDAALRPAFTGALGRRDPDARFEVLAATTSFPETVSLEASSRLLALAVAVDRPLDLSPDRDAWLARNLPPDEVAMVAESQLEMLVPVSVGRGQDLVLALGPRRSEEPYSSRDTDLLRAIASSLALVVERAGPIAEPQPSLAECPACARCFDTSHARCPDDGALLLVSGIPNVLRGRYTLRARIGAGGMGTVYSARDESLGRDVAVKVLGEHLVGSAEAAARFEREAKTAASFAHPHVVTIHDFGVAAGNRAFLVMEQLRGRTLREEISEGPVPTIRALAVAADLCDVLDVAHGRGLVHRDLKPENVFLSEGPSPDTKVLDFGIAKALTDSAAPATGGMRTGVLVGTVPYMSPEQLRGEPVAPYWDLWALAVMCQEMLTGERPAGLVPAPPWDPAAAPESRVAAGAAQLTPALRAFFTRALAIDPSQRPATAASFREQFAGAVGEPVSRER